MKKFLYIFLIVISNPVVSQWQPDLRLTNDPAQSYMSGPHQHDIASNGNTIHVVWHDERTNWDIYYKRSPDGGFSWSADTRLSNGPGESHSASVAVSGSNVIVVWNDSRDGHWELFYIRSTDGGISWGTETRLTVNDSFSSSNPVAASIGTVFHLVWEDNRDGNEEIYYRRSTDGGLSWSADVRLTNNTAISYSPSVTVSVSFVHVVWYDDRDGNNEIYYKRSTDGGISWGADIRLSGTPYVSELTAVASSGSNVHVVWQDDRNGSNKQIYYRRSTDAGTTWSTEIHLSNNAGYAAAPTITVSGSNVHVTWQDNRDGNFEVYYKRSIDNGVSWGNDTRLTNAPGNSLRTFSTVNGTALNVVWMDERDGNWEIYFKRDPTGNPTPVPPPAPNLVSPSNGSYNEPSSIRFIWNKPLSAVTYRLQLALDSLFTNIVYNDSTLTDSTIVIANLLTNEYYWWRVNAKNSYGTSPYSDVWKFGTFPVGLKEISGNVPNNYKLSQNYPNPFNPVSRIKFQIVKAGHVKLQVLDLTGRETAKLVDGYLQAGTYEVQFDGSNFASGIYFYKMETGEYTSVKKMVLLK